MPSTGKVIGYTALGMVIGAASVATCGAALCGVGASCGGWSVAAANMPAVLGASGAGGAVAGGGMGYDLAKDDKKKK